MCALKKFSMVIAVAALSLSGSAAWANSFMAKANLDGLNLVPPILRGASGTITLTFEEAPTTLGTSFAAARVPRRNPWSAGTRAPGDETFSVRNIRLYFGQRFANGQPIATLCDDNITGLKCNDDPITEEFDSGKRMFALSDIQFQLSTQTPTPGGNALVDAEGHPDIKVIKALIHRGLIYVVVNSLFEAEIDNNRVIVRYKTPECSFLPSFYCRAPGDIDIPVDDGVIRGTADGAIRGTLRLVN